MVIKSVCPRGTYRGAIPVKDGTLWLIELCFRVKPGLVCGGSGGWELIGENRRKVTVVDSMREEGDERWNETGIVT